jgi:SAM-dependent methyltransferase
MPASVELSEPGSANISRWARGGFKRDYAHRTLRPVEVLLMVRHREELSGRVLELGSGAGRITGYLAALGTEVTGIDISSEMIDEARRRFPEAKFVQGNMQDLSSFSDGSLDAVVVGCNGLDIFEDGDRRQMLRDIRRVLVPGGLLIMSSHNRFHLPQVHGPWYVRRSDPLRFAADLIRLPGRVRRHRELRRFEHDEHGYTVVSDGAHGFQLVHYFITPQAQYRQFEEEDFEPLSCQDLDGRDVDDAFEAPDCPELHYAARSR